MTRIERGRFLAHVLVATILIAGGTCTAGGSKLRKIVVFVQGTSWQVQQQVIERSGSRVLKVLSLVNGAAIQLPEQGTAQALSALQAEPSVKGVYDDPAIAAQGMVPVSADGIVIYIEPAPAPKHESYSWGLDRIGIPDVREEYPKLDGSGVNVAVLDTGIDRNHPEFKKIIANCVNVRANETDCQDNNGHGTHVTGIIAARLNQQGVIGASPNVRIHAIKVLDENGAGQASDLLSGLQWISDQKIKIDLVNMSLGFPQEWGPYPFLETAIQSLYDQGVIMVAAAGNRNPRPVPAAQGAGGDGAGGDTAGCMATAQGAGGDGAGGDTACSCGLPPDEKKTEGTTAQGAGGDGAGGDGSGFCYQTTQVKVPAAYPWVIAVGATDKDDRVTDYSRSGPEMAAHGIVAPGGSRSRNKKGVLKEGILSTDKGGGYGLGIGTSQATAHVTGTLALALQHGALSFNKMFELLKHTSRSDGLPAEWQGVGVIDAERLIDALKGSYNNKDKN